MADKFIAAQFIRKYPSLTAIEIVKLAKKEHGQKINIASVYATRSMDRKNASKATPGALSAMKVARAAVAKPESKPAAEPRKSVRVQLIKEKLDTKDVEALVRQGLIRLGVNRGRQILDSLESLSQA